MAFGAMITGNSGFTQKFISTLFLLMHPVGTPYISENPTSPAELYGGTWERIEGRFIMGASDSYPAGSTGGSANVSIAKTNLPNVRIDVRNFRTEGTQGPNFDVVALNGRSNGSGEFSRTGRTDPLGNGTPLGILNPYYSMYIWRRVA